MKKRIVIVDDLTSVRDMMEIVLSNICGYEVVGQGATGIDAVALCAKLRPDLLILDLMLPVVCGIEVMHRLRAERQRPRLLIYSGTTCVETIRNALRCRPDGFVAKTEALNSLLEGIKAVLAGCRYFTPLASTLLEESFETQRELVELTRRERELVQMVAEGHSSKEIATRLAIKVKTVENHRQHLMEKLRVRNIAGVTRYAISHGM